ncbi:O-Glycosyl hydrolase family 30 [Gigaspora margarita]|uniref:O-Glycosyl hydrolase family 30 n=1 Tax=Gigaspora margarita TaxID=4874 RepID=A0A8H4B4I5_GIGMA|nr:O-Glycosyl hydrolase family 30 [Gigaspora margarita]
MDFTCCEGRGADIFEAFANSPPYWMTNSNCSFGGQNNTNNLNSDYYDKFADYLTEVVKWYKEEQGLTFRTLEPFNEPTTGFWHEFGMNAQFCLYTEVDRIVGPQEGCTYSYLAMTEVIAKVGAYLNNKDLLNTTSVSIADEGLFEGEIISIATISTLKQILFDMAKNDGRRLWMSEWGSWSSKDMSASIILSEQILNDMRNLKPIAWSYWQVIEHAPNGTYGNDYGADFSNSTTSLDIRLSFYGFAQYTKFIRPGYQIISSDDGDTLAAQDASKKTLVLVCTNKNNASDVWNINVSKFNISSFNTYRTSNDNETLKLLPNTWIITDGILTYESPANSITTWVFNVIQ